MTAAFSLSTESELDSETYANWRNLVPMWHIAETQRPKVKVVISAIKESNDLIGFKVKISSYILFQFAHSPLDERLDYYTGKFAPVSLGEQLNLAKIVWWN